MKKIARFFYVLNFVLSVSCCFVFIVGGFIPLIPAYVVVVSFLLAIYFFAHCLFAYEIKEIEYPHE